MRRSTETVAAEQFTTGVGRRYRYEWALFADWCTAMERRCLPADSATVLEFLVANPAGEATHVRRVSAINWVHCHRGHSEPGAAPALRETLDSRRQQRLVDLRSTLAPILQQQPTSGWPGGLFGRRDAVVLLFAGAGLRFDRIARLRRDEVSVAGNDVSVGDHRITTDWTGGSPPPRSTSGGSRCWTSPRSIRVRACWPLHCETIGLLHNDFRRNLREGRTRRGRCSCPSTDGAICRWLPMRG